MTSACATRVMLVPLVLAIIAFALYPQQALEHSEPTVQRVVGGAAAAVARRGRREAAR